MAAPSNTPTVKIINGAASATLATAVSNVNTALATFLANASSAIWNPLQAPQVFPIQAVVATDAAVANDQYMFYATVSYLAA